MGVDRCRRDTMRALGLVCLTLSGQAFARASMVVRPGWCRRITALCHVGKLTSVAEVLTDARARSRRPLNGLLFDNQPVSFASASPAVSSSWVCKTEHPAAEPPNPARPENRRRNESITPRIFLAFSLLPLPPHESEDALLDMPRARRQTHIRSRAIRIIGRSETGGASNR